MDFTGPYQNQPINEIVDAWGEWIGEEAAAQFAQWGYCSVPFRMANGDDIGSSSRVLVLNTQAANKANYYLAGFKNDPSDHIAWLEA
jgi:hypothetical protein